MSRGNTRWTHARAPDLDPWREQDACGVGFVARVSGERSREVARLALEALRRVARRGAAATDSSGDGAGVLTQIPAPLFYREAERLGLPLPAGESFAVGRCFRPREAAALARVTAIIEDVLRGDGLSVLGWREVPVRLDVLGAGARATCPTIRQVLIGPAADRRGDTAAWERALYLARKTIDSRLADGGPELESFFVCSLSARTIVYKALLTGTQLGAFFPDLESPDFHTALAVFHQRYSTNTTSSWPLAQPFRLLAHNGEINTLWGNRNAMRAREPALASPLWEEDVDRLKPVIWTEGSDSTSLDNALELLVRSGRGPGELLVVDTRRKAILHNAEAKREVARRRPYARWAAKSIRPLRPTAPAPAGPETEIVTRQLAFGWSFEDVRYVLEPMGGEGQDAVWSMGDDTPIPPLARVPPGLYAYLRQRFAQVTNPPIDPLRETLVMSLRMHLGRRGSLLADRPSGLRLVRNEHPVLLENEMAALRGLVGAQAVTLDATWQAAGGPESLCAPLDALGPPAGGAGGPGGRV